ncbi:DUF397 domain-containing protein [Streptomyces uncialis]|uniref:DUF397 domain-containing protein n=1 Tax=Streptomyces uncialis TaxID=1048205 RepID=UPI0038100BE6
MASESAPRTREDELRGAFWHKSSHSGSDNACAERGNLRSGRQAIRDTADRSSRGPLVFEPNA